MRVNQFLNLYAQVFLGYNAEAGSLSLDTKVCCFVLKVKRTSATFAGTVPRVQIRLTQTNSPQLRNAKPTLDA